MVEISNDDGAFRKIIDNLGFCQKIAQRHMDGLVAKGQFSPDVRRAVNKLVKVEVLAFVLQTEYELGYAPDDRMGREILAKEIGEDEAQEFDFEMFLRGGNLYVDPLLQTESKDLKTPGSEAYFESIIKLVADKFEVSAEDIKSYRKIESEVLDQATKGIYGFS